MKRQAEPLGVLMCLPLALLGAAVGAFVGLFVLLLAFGLRSGDGQIGWWRSSSDAAWSCGWRHCWFSSRSAAQMIGGRSHDRNSSDWRFGGRHSKCNFSRTDNGRGVAPTSPPRTCFYFVVVTVRGRLVVVGVRWGFAFGCWDREGRLGSRALWAVLERDCCRSRQPVGRIHWR